MATILKYLQVAAAGFLSGFIMLSIQQLSYDTVNNLTLRHPHADEFPQFKLEHIQ